MATDEEKTQAKLKMIREAAAWARKADSPSPKKKQPAPKAKTTTQDKDPGAEPVPFGS